MQSVFKVLNYQGNSNLEIVSPAAKSIPKWYKAMPKFVKWEGVDYPTIKGCAPFYDALATGYVYTLPSDVRFYFDGQRPRAKVLDNDFISFVEERPQSNMEEAVPTPGYHLEHFHFNARVGIQLPRGYSALYTHPLNRFDLPIGMTSGIIDNDNFSAPGQIPFFLKLGYEGVLEKGTPFLQVIPIKRKDWKMEWLNLSQKESHEELSRAEKKYRGTTHGGYRENDWNRKIYR